MKTRWITVSVDVKIEYPDDLYSEQFYEEFDKYIHEREHSEEDHLCFLAERFVLEGEPSFVEGVGDLREKGVKAQIIGWDSDVEC